MLQHGAKFDPWIRGGIAPCARSGGEFPGAALPKGEEPAETNEAIHQVLLGQLGSRGGGDLLQEGAGHHGGLPKLELLDHPGEALRECPCLHPIGYHVSILRYTRLDANMDGLAWVLGGHGEDRRRRSRRPRSC